MGNILFPMSSLSNMVTYDRDLLLDKLLHRVQLQNKKISDLQIKLLQQKLQNTSRSYRKRHHMRNIRNNNSRHGVDDAIIEKLEKMINKKFQKYKSQSSSTPSPLTPLLPSTSLSPSTYRQTQLKRYNSLNLLKINEWQRDHNTCNYHYHCNEYEKNNPHLNFHVLRNRDHYGSSLVSSDSFSWKRGRSRSR